MSKFSFLKMYTTPLPKPKLQFYFGKVAMGTPIFLPRRWVKDRTKPGYLSTKPRVVGFDFVDLGWKIKWGDTDYRFEWHPIWSFVFFGLQICVTFMEPDKDDYWYWEKFLYYTRENLTLSKEERLKLAYEHFPRR